MATPISRPVSVAFSPPGARKATSANSGTMARSSNSRIATMRRPPGSPIARRSSIICMTMAVEVSTNPVPATKLCATG
ncbi:hypothetical protein D3C86_1908360 [compost metagenome]